MGRKSVLRDKSFDFAVRSIKLSQYLRKKFGEFEISKQVIRSGTSIGAIVREAEFAESRKDFVHKLYIGLKETNEISYWLDLLYATKYIDKKMFDSMKNDANQILRLLIASIKTSKKAEGENS